MKPLYIQSWHLICSIVDIHYDGYVIRFANYAIYLNTLTLQSIDVTSRAPVKIRWKF